MKKSFIWPVWAYLVLSSVFILSGCLNSPGEAERASNVENPQNMAGVMLYNIQDTTVANAFPVTYFDGVFNTYIQRYQIFQDYIEGPDVDWSFLATDGVWIQNTDATITENRLVTLGGFEFQFTGGQVDITGDLYITDTNTRGILIYDSSTANNSPLVEIRGRRSDANVSQSYSGGIALSALHTGGAVPINKKLGTIYFGGNHTDGTESNLAYTASISAIAEAAFGTGATNEMETGLVFYTGDDGYDLGTPNQDYGIERMRIGYDGLVTIKQEIAAETVNEDATVDNLVVWDSSDDKFKRRTVASLGLGSDTNVAQDDLTNDADHTWDLNGFDAEISGGDLGIGGAAVLGVPLTVTGAQIRMINTGHASFNIGTAGEITYRADRTNVGVGGTAHMFMDYTDNVFLISQGGAITAHTYGVGTHTGTDAYVATWSSGGALQEKLLSDFALATDMFWEDNGSEITTANDKNINIEHANPLFTITNTVDDHYMIMDETFIFFMDELGQSFLSLNGADGEIEVNLNDFGIETQSILYTFDKDVASLWANDQFGTQDWTLATDGLTTVNSSTDTWDLAFTGSSGSYTYGFSDAGVFTSTQLNIVDATNNIYMVGEDMILRSSGTNAHVQVRADEGLEITDGTTTVVAYIDQNGDAKVNDIQIDDPTAAVGYVWTATDIDGNGQWEAATGGATQLSDLTDVNTSTPTNRNVLVADGVDWESRALVEADISDLQSYLLTSDIWQESGGTITAITSTDDLELGADFDMTGANATFTLDDAVIDHTMSANSREWGYKMRGTTDPVNMYITMSLLDNGNFRIFDEATVTAILDWTADDADVPNAMKMPRMIGQTNYFMGGTARGQLVNWFPNDEETEDQVRMSLFDDGDMHFDRGTGTDAILTFKGSATDDETAATDHLNYVGVNNNDPQRHLDVKGETESDPVYLRLSNNDNNVVADQVVSGVEFWSNDNQLTGSGETVAMIEAISTNADGEAELLFYTLNNDPSNQLVEHMRLDQDGNFGIGTNDPSATLDVVGTLQYVDGNEAAGYVLTSDANGNASWAVAAGGSSLWTDAGTYVHVTTSTDAVMVGSDETPSEILEVHDADAYISLKDTDNGNLEAGVEIKGNDEVVEGKFGYYGNAILLIENTNNSDIEFWVDGDRTAYVDNTHEFVAEQYSGVTLQHESRLGRYFQLTNGLASDQEGAFQAISYDTRAGNGPEMRGYKAGDNNGTRGTPSILASANQRLFRIESRAYNGSNAVSGGGIEWQNSEVWTGSTRGTNVMFGATPSGTNTEVTFMWSDGAEVGFFTDDPYHEVEIEGTGSLLMLDSDSGTSLIQFNDTGVGSFPSIGSVSNGIGIYSDDDVFFRDAGGTTTFVTIDSDGDLTMNSTNPTGTLNVGSFTTTERGALTDTNNGDIIYNETTNQFEAYENGAWTAMIGAGGGDGNGIYDGSGSLSTTTGVSLNGQALSFTGTNVQMAVATDGSTWSLDYFSGSTRSERGIDASTAWIGTDSDHDFEIIQHDVVRIAVKSNNLIWFGDTGGDYFEMDPDSEQFQVIGTTASAILYTDTNVAGVGSSSDDDFQIERNAVVMATYASDGVESDFHGYSTIGDATQYQIDAGDSDEKLPMDESFDDGNATTPDIVTNDGIEIEYDGNYDIYAQADHDTSGGEIGGIAVYVDSGGGPTKIDDARLRPTYYQDTQWTTLGLSGTLELNDGDIVYLYATLHADDGSGWCRLKRYKLDVRRAYSSR